MKSFDHYRNGVKQFVAGYSKKAKESFLKCQKLAGEEGNYCLKKDADRWLGILCSDQAEFTREVLTELGVDS